MQYHLSPNDVKDVAEEGLDPFRLIPPCRVSGIGGEYPETLKHLGDTLEATIAEDAALLVTDNPLAEKDVPKRVSIRRYHILESRLEEPLEYYVVGKSKDLDVPRGFNRLREHSLFSQT
jgi:hypothetical protein